MSSEENLGPTCFQRGTNKHLKFQSTRERVRHWHKVQRTQWKIKLKKPVLAYYVHWAKQKRLLCADAVAKLSLFCKEDRNKRMKNLGLKQLSSQASHIAVHYIISTLHDTALLMHKKFFRLLGHLSSYPTCKKLSILRLLPLGKEGGGLVGDLFTGQNKNNTRYVQGELLIMPIFGVLDLQEICEKKAQIPED